MPDADPLPPPKPLADCFEPDQQTLDIYLAIPHYRERGVNVAQVGRMRMRAIRRKWRCFGTRIPGLSEKPVQVARKNFRIPCGGRIAAAFVRSTRRPCAADDSGDVSWRRGLCASAGYFGQRLPDIDSSPAGGNPVGEELATGRARGARRISAWPNSVHPISLISGCSIRSIPFPADAAHLRNQSGTSGADCMRRCCRWRGA